MSHPATERDHALAFDPKTDIHYAVSEDAVTRLDGLARSLAVLSSLAELDTLGIVVLHDVHGLLAMMADRARAVVSARVIVFPGPKP